MAQETFNLPSTFGNSNQQVFASPHSSLQFDVWMKPRGVSMVSILCVGSGGAGGAGGGHTTGSDPQGGGGGGSAGIGFHLFPACLLPDVMLVHVAKGGLNIGGGHGSPGDTSYVCITPVAATVAAEIVAISSDPSTPAAGGIFTTAAATGGAGASAATTAMAIYSCLGVCNWTAGTQGATGGNNVAGANVTVMTGLNVCGGAGGGGNYTTGTGGNVTGAGSFPSVLGGGTVNTGVFGSGGFVMRLPGLQYEPNSAGSFRACGGCGGGPRTGGVLPVAGYGGNGSIGCGGGGGGGASVGGFRGLGGDGGNGLVVIAAW